MAPRIRKMIPITAMMIPIVYRIGMFSTKPRISKMTPRMITRRSFWVLSHEAGYLPGALGSVDASGLPSLRVAMHLAVNFFGGLLGRRRLRLLSQRIHVIRRVHS